MMTNIRPRIAARWLAAFAALAAMPVAASDAQEWTRFRGPNGTGHGVAENVPVSWSDDDYNWTIELPGIGHSSPVLWGMRVFITSAENDGAKRNLFCLDADDGAVLWQRQFASTSHTKHARNSFASSTPAVDEQHVYVFWTTPESYTVMALDHEGQIEWQRDLGPFESQHSSGVSPIVYEDLLVAGNDQDGVSSLVALDRRSGESRWFTARQSERVAYSTPCVHRRSDGRDELIFLSGAHGVSAIDPQSGNTNWEIDVFDKRTVGSPIVAGGLIIGSCGSGAGGNYVAAVRPGDTSTGAEPEEVFRVDQSAPYVPTSIASDDLVFLWGDRGVVTCIRTPTGETVWRQRVGSNFSGSPVLVDGRLYCISDEGDVFVVAGGESFELLARVPLGEESRSTPAIAGGRMYLRTVSHLYSLGGAN